VLGRHDEALDALEAMSLADRQLDGWNGWVWQFLRDYDPTLDAIRDDPRFQAAFAEVEVEMAKQLEHVRKMEQNGEVVTIEELQAMQE